MEYTKPYRSFADQVQIWVDRGLIVKNIDEAERVFSRLNYYRLSAYALPFQLQKDSFNPGTSWEEIINLYEFDRNLRLLLLGNLEILEVAFRTSICHYLAKSYGSFGYMDKANFHPDFEHAVWIERFKHEKQRSTETFIKHFNSKYEQTSSLPIWMAAEIMSFGTVSKLYKGLGFKDKKNIARLYNVPATVFENWLHFFTYIRNLCAHHARVWNRELAIRPKYPDKNLNFDNIRNDRIVCFFVIVNYLFDKLAVKTDVLEQLNKLLTEYPNIQTAHMGFKNDFSCKECLN